ncbi:MAG: hypothetical protein H8E46_07940 [FCB group bacterium]|nr:hypothetical protein [FCB group bacterium]
MSSSINDKYSDFYDVEDEDRFRKYCKKMSEWKNGLSNSANPNSVFSRFFELLKYHYLYKTIRGLYSRSQDNPHNELGFNTAITNLIEAGYVHFLTITIRALIEPQSEKPQKRINSLRSIIDDIAKNAHLITRECYLAICNLPFDYQKAEFDYQQKSALNTQEFSPDIRFKWRVGDSKGPFAYQESEKRHELFDKISGTSFDSRNRNDTIRLDIFKQLICQLGSCSCIKDFANDNFAHFSITTPKNKQNSVTFNRVEKCIEDLFRIYNYVNEYLLGKGKTSPKFILPIDMWKNIDKKWALNEQEAIDIYNDIEAEMKKRNIKALDI